MALVSKGRSIPCCVDVDASFEAKAKYALHMLLVPLGLEPEWVERTSARIYYGAAVDVGPAVRFAASERAVHFFAGRESYDAQMATWFDGAEGHLPAMFASEAGEPDYVASTFLWLSGWQEAVADTRDEHGRVPYGASLSAALEIPHRPVVDAYRTEVAKLMRQGGLEVSRRRWQGKDWALCPTHDVDYLRKWRLGVLYREFLQNLLLNRRGVPPGKRLRTAANAFRQMGREDPYQAALREMPEEVSRRGGTATYFFKAGGKDPHDVPYRLDDPYLEERFGDLAARGFEVGLHPSYRTPEDPSLLRAEAASLRSTVGREIFAVRQHYLRYDPVTTPRVHDDVGFAVDSTIGFADHEGFRRGTCQPFQLYDLEGDEPLRTWEMPLAIMDSALFNRRQLGLEAAIDVTHQLAGVCRRYGGVLVVLWHNVLGDELEAPGWKRHFTETLEDGAQTGAAIASLSGALEGWR